MERCPGELLIQKTNGSLVSPSMAWLLGGFLPMILENLQIVSFEDRRGFSHCLFTKLTNHEVMRPGCHQGESSWNGSQTRDQTMEMTERLGCVKWL